MNNKNENFKKLDDYYKNKINNLGELKGWLDDNIQDIVDTNLATGKIHEIQWLLKDKKDPHKMLTLSQEASDFINRAINGRTSITLMEKNIIKKCFVDNYMMKNDVENIEYLAINPTDKNVSKCTTLTENDIINPLISKDNINTDMSNMLIKEIDLNSLDICLLCGFGFGIIAGFYLLYKLLNYDK
jgi:hypothetical protein